MYMIVQLKSRLKKKKKGEGGRKKKKEKSIACIGKSRNAIVWHGGFEGSWLAEPGLPVCETSLCAAFLWYEQIWAEKATSVFGRDSNIFQFGSVLISGDD